MLWRLTGGFARAADREDLMQEIMMRIWIALPRFERRSKLSTWAYQVGLFTAYEWARKHRREPDEAALVERCAEAGLGREAADALEAVYAALRRMKELDRSILILALEETPVAEMAEILGINENAAHTRLHRARKRLGQLLKEDLT